MLVLPLLYVVAFGVLAIDASFAALMVFRFTQVAWLQGGAASSWEAVINTVPPDRRDQTRAFLYGGPTQVGTILAGVIALIGERALSPSVLYLVGLACAVLATVAMVGVRRAYPRELVQALREGRPSVFGSTAGRHRTVRADARRRLGARGRGGRPLRPRRQDPQGGGARARRPGPVGHRGGAARGAARRRRRGASRRDAVARDRRR